jgi:GNAT superfamily N-acetyltransferase
MFWGHTPRREGSGDASCLSQWFCPPFTVDGQVYPTAEHWMMAGKARLFADTAAVAEVLGDPEPRTAKAIGRRVRGFDEAAWRTQDVTTPRVRPVVGSDRAGIERLRERCGEDAWSVSGLSDVGALGYIYPEGVEITAMAGLREKSDKVGDLCVLTDPRLRGEGRGAAVVSAVTRDALASGCLVLYQTLEANRAAVRLALSLGFARYGNHLAVRLAGPNAEHGGP